MRYNPPMEAHSSLSAISLLVALAVPIAAGPASAQAASFTVFSGLSIPAPMLQATLPRPDPGGPVYAPTVTMPVPGLVPNVIPVPGQSAEKSSPDAAGHDYDGPVVVLDDRALEGVR